MPLSEKVRIEVYIPDLPQQISQNLLDALAQEFTYTFGGATHGGHCWDAWHRSPHDPGLLSYGTPGLAVLPLPGTPEPPRWAENWT